MFQSDFDFRADSDEYLRIKLKSEKFIFRTFWGTAKTIAQFDLLERSKKNIDALQKEMQHRRMFGSDEILIGEFDHAA